MTPRVHTAAMVDAVRSVGFESAVEHVTLVVRDLIYASSAHAIERILRRAEGVADVSVDLPAGRVIVTALPERPSRDYFQVLLTWLGFRRVGVPTPDPATGFVVRCLFVIGAAIMLIMAALNHPGIFGAATEPPSLFWLIALGTFVFFGAGYPFYRRAFAVLAQGEFDASVMIALVASATFFGGLLLALISRDRQAVWVWSAWVAFMLAAILTAGWFIGRGLALWVLPRFRHSASEENMAALTAPQSQVTSERVADPSPRAGFGARDSIQRHARKRILSSLGVISDGTRR